MNYGWDFGIYFRQIWQIWFRGLEPAYRQLHKSLFYTLKQHFWIMHFHKYIFKVLQDKILTNIVYYAKPHRYEPQQRQHCFTFTNLKITKNNMLQFTLYHITTLWLKIYRWFHIIYATHNSKRRNSKILKQKLTGIIPEIHQI